MEEQDQAAVDGTEEDTSAAQIEGANDDDQDVDETGDKFEAKEEGKRKRYRRKPGGKGKEGRKKRYKKKKSGKSQSEIGQVRLVEASDGGKKDLAGNSEISQEVDVQFLEGNVGLRLSWQDGEAPPGLRVQGFPPLPNGIPSVAKASGILKLGAKLTAVNGRPLTGLSREDVVQRIREANQLPDGFPPIFRFEHTETSNDRVEEEPSSKPPPIETGKPRKSRSTFKKVSPKRTSPSSLSGSPKKATSDTFEEQLANSVQTLLDFESSVWDGYRDRFDVEESNNNGKSQCVVRVTNLSYELAHKYYMGTRASRWQHLERTKMSNAWEARVKRLRPSFVADSDDPRAAMEIETWFVGSFPSEAQAAKAADRAIEQRNMGSVKNSPRPNRALCASEKQITSFRKLYTHFKLTIESDLFDVISFWERQRIVWDALRRSPVLDGFRMTSPVIRLRKFSWVGECVKSLPIFQFLPFTFVIVCIATGKEKHRERLVLRGAPAEILQGVGEAQVKAEEKGRKPFTKSDLVEMIREDENESEDESDPKRRNQGKISLEALLNGDKAGKPQRSRFKHFYKGLSKEAQRLMELERRDQERLRDRKPTKVSSSLFQASGAYDSTEENYVENPERIFWLNKRRVHKAAVLLQRLFRMRFHSMMVRDYYRRERFSIELQRWWRGLLGLWRAQAWQVLAHGSATKLQSVWRMYRARLRVRKMRVRFTAAVLLIQPIVRGLVTRKLLEWRKRDDWAATRIQKSLRGFLARKVFKLLRARHYHEHVVVPAACLIQRVFRGMRDRAVAKALREDLYYREVVIPSTVLLQAMFRRRVAEKILQELKAKQFAATMVQRLLRGKVARIWFARMLGDHKCHQAASSIAAVIRGSICRTLFRYRKEEHYYETVLVPAATRIQSAWKGMNARIMFRILIAQDAAIAIIQAAWRAVLAKRKARETVERLVVEYKNKLAIRLQAAFRGQRDRKRCLILAREQRARRIEATVDIQRYWRAYVGRKSAEQRALLNQIRLHFAKVESVAYDVIEISDDVKDVFEDRNSRIRYRKKCEKQIRKLKRLRVEIERRLPEVEKELENLTEEDHERGWGDAFETEWDTLTNRIAMSQEEILSKRYHITLLEIEVAGYDLELDELEVELDRHAERSVVLIEEGRRMQIDYICQRFQDHKARMIRKQKDRWRIDSVRSKVIARKNLERDAQQGSKLDDEVLSYSQRLDRAQTITVSKREKYKNASSYRRQVQVLRERFAQYERIRAQGERNPALINTYNDLVTRIHQLTQSFSYDLRRPKSDGRTNPLVYCQTCGFVVTVCKCNRETTEDTLI